MTHRKRADTWKSERGQVGGLKNLTGWAGVYIEMYGVALR